MSFSFARESHALSCKNDGNGGSSVYIFIVIPDQHEAAASDPCSSATVVVEQSGIKHPRQPARQDLLRGAVPLLKIFRVVMQSGVTN